MAAVPGYGSSASKVGHSGRARVWGKELRKKSPRPLLRDTCQGGSGVLVTRCQLLVSGRICFGVKRDEREEMEEESEP